MKNKMMICPDLLNGKCEHIACFHARPHLFKDDDIFVCDKDSSDEDYKCPSCIENPDKEKETREQIDKRIAKFARRDKDDYIEHSIDSSDSSFNITLTLPSDANITYPTNNYPRGL